MKRLVSLSLLAFIVLGLPLIGIAGTAHFTSCASSVSNGTVCAEGKEAGLGNLDQVHIVLTVVAHCQNRGGKDPSAANKETFGAEGTFPVQNGRALFEVCVDTEFSPECDPPMATIVDSITLVDTTNNIACSQISH